MPAFDYVALDAGGRRRKGVVEADSERQTRQLLRERTLTPLSVHEAIDSKAKRSPATRFRQAIRLRDVSMITRQLATLVQAGLPVEKALQTLSRQSDRASINSMLSAIRALIVEGHTLSGSLTAYPHVFTELYRATVHAGERTGHLGTVLEHLATHTEAMYQARQRILLALLYPAILTGVSLSIVLFMLAYLIPSMARVFAGSGQALPMLTRALIATGEWLQQDGWLFVIALIALGVMIRRLLRRPDRRAALDKRMLRWPLVGSLVLQQNTAQLAATLGILQESGVPLVAALDIAVATVTNRHLQHTMRQMATEVREGASLSRAMERSGIMPPVVISMAASGEASGQLGDMLQRAGAIQRRDLENRTALLLGLFEPMILLVMGGMVLVLVLAIIMPILTLNQLVK